MLWVVSLLGALLLAVVHVQAYRLKFEDIIPRSKWLSFAGGISIAYIFVHLLPELEKMQREVVRGEIAVLSWFQFPLYVLALGSLCLYYGIERHAKRSGESEKQGGGQALEGGDSGREHAQSGIFYFHIFSFALYNALIGYTIQEEEWSHTSLLLFVLAMGFHFLVNDIGFVAHYRDSYIRRGRWILAVAPVVGWGIGRTFTVAHHYQAIALAFIAGGTILNVFKEELPEERKSSFWAFFTGVSLYSLLLLLME